MSEHQIDPAGNTQQFKAFAQQNEQAAAEQKRSYALPITIAVVLVAIVAVAAYLLLR
ncbi:flagellar basal body-associated protein FliL [Thermocatellispora tengchongensis]|uniref:Flagellar basal body-associated protein FliL n=1 Tax=Thermocatellispora tengchongensis TaxID=1073253 RepID=A0A840P5G5_9ACTN|nr:hypothetical protein [Thermocatellispora tengchongensis]MBB5134908.1 flagellar basal body-associated protein FliL [Thermocatellispora tengchongensis]